MPFTDPDKRRVYHAAYSKKWDAEHREERLAYQREWRRKWRIANPGKNKAAKQASHLKHRDKNLRKMRDWYKQQMADPVKCAKAQAERKAWALENPDKHRASIRNWHATHRDHVRTYARKHSALRRHRVGNFTHEQWVARFKFYGERCAYCLKALTLKSATIDHIIPIIKGGTNWASNLAPACRPCNVRKNRNRLLPLWLRK